ncbi:tetratricopeptide repeat protein, partial [Neochlamydia sp. AcF95]|uniref:tetratricopeptide repeat protein n=1 Tax=Neochlamydia sp. AcF95 TaxID=2795734 RepID=UPI001BC9A5EA
HDSSLDEQESIKGKLSKVEILLSKACKGKTLDFSINKKQFEDNRGKLKKFRREIEEKIQALGSDPSPEKVQEIYHEIALWIKTFFKHLVGQAQEVLGSSPCEYAMIGFGSLAREEMTPYSDLEFGILMQEDTFGNRNYFRHLTTLLHLKVINLGETILPALNIPCIKEVDFFDSVTPRGFAFDGEGAEGKGCKTPFGDRQTFELIQTPEKMAQYIGKDEKGQWWHKKERHLPMELLTFTFLIDNCELIRQYQQKIEILLDSIYQEGLTLRHYLAKQHLFQEDKINFNPGIHGLSNQGMLFKVKNDFYRFPHLAFDRLSLLQKEAPSDTFSRIEELNKQGILTNEAAEKLKDWISIALFMRLETYSHYRAQQEMMNPLIKPFGFDDPGFIKKQFALDQKALEKIKKIYRIFIPFYQAIQDFLAGNEETLQSSKLNDDSYQTQGNIALRLYQLDEAKKWYRLAKKAGLGNSTIFNILGIIYAKEGNLNKAAKYIQQALTIPQNPDIVAISYANLGLIYKDQGYLEQAVEHAKKALVIHLTLFGENHPAIATSYNNLGQIYQDHGNLEQAAEYTKKALDIRLKLLGENHPPVATSYNNLGQIYQGQGNLEQAVECTKKALAINLKLFGENHPTVATSYNNLGLIYQDHGNLEQAVEYTKKALAIDLKLFGENHPTVVISYGNLGQIYKEQGNLEQAAEYAKKALAIHLKLFGENHPMVATTYSNLGQIYQEQGNLGQAIEYTKKALAINLKLFGENHPTVARDHNNLGQIYQGQGDLGQAIEYTKKALAIALKISGENHPTVATSYNNLGQIYQDHGNVEQAVEYAKKALAIKFELFGENHPTIATSYGNLGQIYKRQGNLEQAVEYAKKALAS